MSLSLRPVPYLVVPTDPAWRFEVRRLVQPRPVVFVDDPAGSGLWPCQLPERLRGKTFVTPFDTEQMSCPYGAAGQELFVRVKGKAARKEVPVRLMAVRCESGPSHPAVWILSLERI